MVFPVDAFSAVELRSKAKHRVEFMTVNTDSNRATSEKWIAQRTTHFDSSGIRRVFDLAAKLKNPINLSIGQPDFDVPNPVKERMIQAIQDGKNGYSPTQGIQPLRQRLQDEVRNEYPDSDRQLLVTSGTSGGLMLALLAMVDPGDEVVIFDPYFVMYEPLVRLASGTPVLVDLNEQFQIDVQRFEDALTPKTKLVLLNSPGNPTGVCLEVNSVRAVAEICAKRQIAVISDEIYRHFCFDSDFSSPAKFNSETIVIDGFSKSHAMTGWRLGFVHGPAHVIETMTKLQQYTFVCAPQPVQWAGLAALDCDITPYVQDYRQKRDRLYAGLHEHYDLVKPDGAFYMYPRLPWGDGDSFIQAAIERELLIIPGNIFSRHDTHFRLSFAASDEQLDRGIEVLQSLASAR